MALTNVKEVFTTMPEVFNSGAAQGLDVAFQFDITGEGGGSWNVVVKDGACQIQEGTHEAPNVTLTMSCETWLSIVNRELNAMQAHSNDGFLSHFNSATMHNFYNEKSRDHSSIKRDIRRLLLR